MDRRRLRSQPFRRTRVPMGRHSRPRGPSRAIPALGAGAGALSMAAIMALLQTAAVATVSWDSVPTVGQDLAASADGVFDGALQEASDAGGPLQIPAIGVVAPGFDEWYASGAPLPGVAPVLPAATARLLGITVKPGAADATADRPALADVLAPPL